jgi:oxygen-dependent protoporphyrinogen oxidase
MPQYEVGHLARVTEIERAVAEIPAFAIAGAAYRGVGIPDCIRSGENAADAIFARLQAPK